MLFDPPLPNDLLRNPPWNETIISWPVNDEFLSLINGSESKLREAGYFLRYGIEVNLKILTTSEAQKVVSDRNDQNYILSYWRQASREHFSSEAARASTESTYPAFAAQVYSQLEIIAAHHVSQPNSESEAWLQRWSKTQKFYQDSLAASSGRKRGLAQKNFMIASLHLLPQHLGGLEGLIEQRFASEHYGFGWWDGKDILELRTLHVEGGENAIRNYHIVLWRLQQAVEQFGFVPMVNLALAQPHFSAWMKSSNSNIMASDDDGAFEFRKNLAQMFYDGFNIIPWGRFSKMSNLDPVTSAPFAGSSRISAIRTCDDNWELRLPPVSGVTHLARDIYYIAYTTLMSLTRRTSADMEEQPENAELADAVSHAQDSKIDDITPERPIEEIKRLSISADPPRVACPFVSCLEAAVLGNDNELLVPRAAIGWNLPMLARAVGRHGVDLFSTQAEDHVHNLTSIVGWQELFKTIRIRHARELDTSAIHPSLAKHFDGLSVVSVRRDVHIPEMHYELDRESSCDDIGKARLLGWAYDTGDELGAPLRAIFNFVFRQNTILDKEEAANYLIDLYERVWAAFETESEPQSDQRHRVSRSSKRMMDTAVFGFLDSAIDRFLNYSGYYKEMGLNEKSPGLDDVTILQNMITHREAALAALPEVASYRRRGAKRFFEMLGEYLCDTEKLYSFKNMSRHFLSMRVGIAWSTASNIYEEIRENGTHAEGTAWEERISELKKQFIELGLTHSIRAVKLVAAAQSDETKTTGILEDYSKHSEKLAKRAKPPQADAPEEVLLAHDLGESFLAGLQAGIGVAANFLMTHREPINTLRHQALEGLSGLSS